MEFERCLEGFAEELDYLHRTVRRHGVPVEDAEDAVQDVFLVMLRRWHEYDHNRPLRPWLAGIAMRTAHGWRRRRRHVSLEVAAAVDPAPGPEDHLHARRARTLVLAALAALPEKHRTVLVLHDLEERSTTEVAELLGTTRKTAWARTRAARESFARAVRRLTTTGGLRGLWSVTPMLASERLIPPVPSSLRRRALERARNAAAAPRLAPPPELPLPLTAGVLTGAVAAVMTVALLAGHPGSRTAGPPPADRPALATRLPRLDPDPITRVERRPSPPTTAASGITGPVAYFPLDEATGATTAHDLSGNANHCQLRGEDGPGVWVPGPRGTALALGGQAWLDCPRVGPLAHLADEITVAAWIRPRSGWGNQAIVARQLGTSRADDLFFGLINDQLVMKSRTFRKELYAPLPRRPGEWIHVAFTRRADGTSALYADGRPIGESRGRPMRVGGGWTRLTIGGALNGPDPDRADELFGGDIDDVVIFGRALGPGELGRLAVP